MTCELLYNNTIIIIHFYSKLRNKQAKGIKYEKLQLQNVIILLHARDLNQKYFGFKMSAIKMFG